MVDDVPVTTRLVLFDLGGVLIDLPYGVPAGTAHSRREHEALWHRWLTSDWVRRFECGQCSPQEFADGMVVEWDLPCSSQEYLDYFRDWLIGLAPGADDLIRSLRPELRTGCLSNSNVVHWPRKCEEMRICELVDEYYLSFQLGVCKPDPAIYQLTVTKSGLEPGQICFLDDNQLNVDGALAAGIDAERVDGVPGAREALQRRGLLADPQA